VLEAVLAGLVLGLGFEVWWRSRRPKLEVHENPDPICPKPLPETQAEIDAELKRLKRIK
jgi:hypothetical protein